MRKRGFTLIELLVVIAIIAILAAILFPVFARAKEKARTATCQSNLKQLATAVHMYVSDYDERFPLRAPHWSYDVPGTVFFFTQPPEARPTSPLGLSRRQAFWSAALQPYIKNWSLFQCPSSTPVCAFSAATCASANPQYSFSYIFNGLLGAYNEAGVKAPSTCMLFMEYFGSQASLVFNVWAPWVQNPAGSAFNWPNSYISPTFDGAGNLLACGTEAVFYILPVWGDATIHNGGLNYAYVDGHVKWQRSGSINSAWAEVDKTNGQPISYWWDGCCPWYHRPIVEE